MSEQIDMDGDAIRYPMVSVPFRTKRYGPLAVALSMMIGGIDGYFSKGKVEEDMRRLLLKGLSFPGQLGYEVGRWSNQCSATEDDGYKEAVSLALEQGINLGYAYYALLDRSMWDYEPSLVIYERTEFVEVFVDACLNYSAQHGCLRDEYVAALRGFGFGV